MQAFKDTGKAPVETEVAIHRIRITLTSRNVKSLEKGKYILLLLLPRIKVDLSYEDKNLTVINTDDVIRYSEPCL